MKTLKSATLILSLETAGAVDREGASACLAHASKRLLTVWKPESDIYSIAELAPITENPKRAGSYQAQLAFHGDADWLTVEIAADLKHMVVRALVDSGWRVVAQNVRWQWVVEEITPIFV